MWLRGHFRYAKTAPTLATESNPMMGNRPTTGLDGDPPPPPDAEPAEPPDAAPMLAPVEPEDGMKTASGCERL